MDPTKKTASICPLIGGFELAPDEGRTTISRMNEKILTNRSNLDQKKADLKIKLFSLFLLQQTFSPRFILLKLKQLNLENQSKNGEIC